MHGLACGRAAPTLSRRARAGHPAAFPSRRTNRPDARNFVQIRRFPVFARNPSAQIRISALLQESLCVICIFLLANFQFKAFCKKSFLQAPPALPPRLAGKPRLAFARRRGWPPCRFPAVPGKSPRRSQFRANPKISRFCKKSICANPHFCSFARKLVRNLHFSSCKFSI